MSRSFGHSPTGCAAGGCPQGTALKRRVPYTLYIYVINESGRGENKKTFWNRCGAAFKNRDGSITLKFDLLPHVSLQVREQRNEKDS
jgi:hypothetical protein